MLELPVRRAAAGIGLMLGMDVAYNIGSFSLSAPQTTQRRIQDEEGSSETPKQSMQWVWISTWKMLLYTGIPSLLSRSWWPFVGGLVVVADVHGSYQYAIRCGKRAKTPGGTMLDTSWRMSGGKAPYNTRP